MTPTPTDEIVALRAISRDDRKTITYLLGRVEADTRELIRAHNEIARLKNKLADLTEPTPSPLSQTQPAQSVELYSRRVPTTTDYPWVEYERNTAAERCIHALREMLKYDGCDGADWHALRLGDARQAAKAALASLDRGGST